MQLVDPMHCGRKTRSGAPCANWTMHGQSVCRMHGGASPQARLKGQERLAALEVPAISAVSQLIHHADSDAVRLAAARWLLEVLGHKASVKVSGEHEITIRVIDEAQPIVLEQSYRNGLSNG